MLRLRWRIPNAHRKWVRFMAVFFAISRCEFASLAIVIHSPQSAPKSVSFCGVSLQFNRVRENRCDRDLRQSQAQAVTVLSFLGDRRAVRPDQRMSMATAVELYLLIPPWQERTIRQPHLLARQVVPDCYITQEANIRCDACDLDECQDPDRWECRLWM